MTAAAVALVLATAIVTTTSTKAARAVGTGVTGPLRVSGNTILDGNANVVTLRGVNRDFEQWPYGIWPDYGSTAPYDVIDIDQMRSFNINFVRITLGSQFWLANQVPCFNHVAAYQSEIDQMVSWVTARHMVALLDLHTEVPPGSPCGSQGTYLREPMADSNAPTFWQQVAARYANNPLVAFELFNEPHGISNAVWLNGGLVSSGTQVPFQATGMQALYNAVRGTGATNLVVVDGNGYAGDPSPIEQTPVQGTNIAYAEHNYTCPHNPPPANDCSANPYDPSAALNAWAPVRATYPVLMTEFGWPDRTNPTYEQNVVNDMEGASPPYAGWAAYTWSGPRGNEPAADLFGIFSNWQYSGTGCPPTNCQTAYTYPANGVASVLISAWARNT